MKSFLKLMIVFAFAFMIPIPSRAMTNEEAVKQLALEARNLASFGNPFGKTGKFEEMYDPTGKPWWMVQLAKEAWSMEKYGNPFGYPISQRVLTQPQAPKIVQVASEPVQPSIPQPAIQSVPQVTMERISSVPVVTVATPVVTPSAPVSVPIVTTPAPVALPHFVGVPYRTVHGIAIRFSQPITQEDPHQMIYRAYCKTPGAPDFFTFPTWTSQEGMTPVVTRYPDGHETSVYGPSPIRIANINEAYGPGHYSCYFRYLDPIDVTSETLEFDL